MKNKQAIIPLFIANSISSFAQGISMLAIPWYFADVLDAPTDWRIIYAGVHVVSIFWSLYAGTLIDRFNRKHLFLWENAVGGIVLLSAALFGFWTGHIPVALAAGVFAFTFFGFNLHYPALYAFAQEITDPKDYGRITSYLEIQGQLTSIVAGGMGALLLSGVEAGTTEYLGLTLSFPWTIEKWSLAQIFLLDACTYAFAFLAILPIRYQAISKRYVETAGIWERFKTGVDYFRQYPLVFIFGNAAYFVFVTTMIINYMLMPDFVKNFLHSEAHVFAIGDAAFGVGALFAGVCITLIFSRTTNVMGCIVCTLLTASMFFLLSFSRSIWVFYGAMLLFGLANSGSRIMRVTYLFQHIPNQVIGRTQGVLRVINALFRLSLILLFSLPFFVGNIGWAFIILGSGCVVAVLVMGWYYEGLIAPRPS